MMLADVSHANEAKADDLHGAEFSVPFPSA
jgi:hypothetical protein